jgi:hypothetical protein
MEQKSENMFDFLHCVQPQTDYEEGEWGVKGMPYSSQYISIQGRALLKRGRLPLVSLCGGADTSRPRWKPTAGPRRCRFSLR